MIEILFIFLYLVQINADPIGVVEQQTTHAETRRILRGHESGDTRPYMVYLLPDEESPQPPSRAGWLCGGVIIHERHILTSAACIADVKHFYVISGTSKFIPTGTPNDCIKYGAKRAVWKCLSKYSYSGEDFDNIKWMSNDIAVVQVEDDFDFKRRIKGCDYVPAKIAFNNLTDSYEKPGVVGTIAGWGSTDRYGGEGEQSLRESHNSVNLLETDVILLSKSNCKKRWDPVYHDIIDESMICAKDGIEESKLCEGTEINCKELVYSDEVPSGVVETENTRRLLPDSDSLQVHTSKHYTRRSKTTTGGFCENDHGGPLIMGQGKSSVVIGIISACKTKGPENKCIGPFLFTSVWKNRNFIACAISRDSGQACKDMLRSKTETQLDLIDWKGANRIFRSNNSTQSRVYA